ncbi:hypothetical protein J5N97_029054 [Dioscorea zingiberensis]|uniref:Uncharacterized protein n=1 Tax=Dioscorea zingiberensis TaxID=325984 RepID=A0A9D5H5J2_9LILI|nr:hypothetical protein J5N97_029054 [Dioscorea zingiberensis]
MTISISSPAALKSRGGVEMVDMGRGDGLRVQGGADRGRNRWESIDLAAFLKERVQFDFKEGDVLKQGQAFCFLPLPVRTGLSVQVNGFFEVSSNRRSIWFGAGMDRGGKLRSDWNRLLLEDMLAPIFNELLLVRHFLKKCDTLFVLRRSYKLVLLEYCLSDLNNVGDYVEGLPLLPLANGHLYRALESSKLVNAKQLSAIMNELLLKIGCKILNPKYRVEHRELSLYVYDGDAAGVLNSIFETVSSDVNQLQILFEDFSIDEKTELHFFLFDPDWYYGLWRQDI